MVELANSIPKSNWVEVPACKECNYILGNSLQNSLEARKAELKIRLKKRYKKLLEMPLWDDSELNELGPGLRKSIETALSKRARILIRLDF